MTPDAWKRMLGEPAWNALIEAGYTPEEPDDALAAILTKASELGFTVPAEAPQLNSAGTKTFLPSGLAALTATGLRRFWASRGHGFILLRVEQLLRAVDGPLLPRLQEMLLGYEEQCFHEGVTAIPNGADDRVFVGGVGDYRGQRQGDLAMSVLRDASPDPEPAKRVHVSNRGDQPKFD